MARILFLLALVGTLFAADEVNIQKKRPVVRAFFTNSAGTNCLGITADSVFADTSRGWECTSGNYDYVGPCDTSAAITVKDNFSMWTFGVEIDSAAAATSALTFDIIPQCYDSQHDMWTAKAGLGVNDIFGAPDTLITINWNEYGFVKHWASGLPCDKLRILTCPNASTTSADTIFSNRRSVRVD